MRDRLIIVLLGVTLGLGAKMITARIEAVPQRRPVPVPQRRPVQRAPQPAEEQPQTPEESPSTTPMT